MKRFLQPIASELSPLYVQRSTRLRFVAGYFTVTGGLTVVMLGAMSLASLAGWGPPRASMGGYAMGLAYGLAVGLGWLWTGRLLGRGERAGGMLAIASLSLPTIAWLVGQPIPGTSLVISALGVAAVASAWRELR